MLNEIKEKLQEIDRNVFYGMVDTSIRETVWDFVVFSRNALEINANKTGCTDVFSVLIAREEYIPEGEDLAVINKMLEISGMRFRGSGEYTYVLKPNTNVVVEMLALEFVRPRKV